MDEWEMELAQKLQQKQIEHAIEKAKMQKSASPTGKCLNCDNPFPPFSELRWCDEECREDWEKRSLIEQRSVT